MPGNLALISRKPGIQRDLVMGKMSPVHVDFIAGRGCNATLKVIEWLSTDEQIIHGCWVQNRIVVHTKMPKHPHWTLMGRFTNVLG